MTAVNDISATNVVVLVTVDVKPILFDSGCVSPGATTFLTNATLPALVPLGYCTTHSNTLLSTWHVHVIGWDKQNTSGQVSCDCEWTHTERNKEN